MTNQGPEDLTQWALCELLHLLTSPAMASQEGWYLKLVQFLFLHGFFEVQKTNESIPLVSTFNDFTSVIVCFFMNFFWLGKWLEVDDDSHWAAGL